ncbi:hypothetical protein MLD38_037274 [Melastoma candidum]|uniref:Uncharacterized protein n=1 Tax=Melastoma candidum TaxID=119954 RepID=A0ACB9LLL5_9MYRT|nr:hypothetical protein MLD38_037274 [Melastoma candidum]
MPTVHEALVRLIVVLPIFATFKEPVISLLRQCGSGGGGMGLPLGAGNEETFFHNTTGRFCDGRIPPVFTAENANLPFIKPYLEPKFSDYTEGANFASCGAGVLPQTLEGALYLELQVSLFSEMTERLKQQKGDSDAQKLISRGVYHICMGGNDYIRLAPGSLDDNATISPHGKEAFVHWVMGNLTTSINVPETHYTTTTPPTDYPYSDPVVSQFHTPYPPSMSHTPPTSEAWLLDSGATHHVTPTSSGLHNLSTYTGNASVLVGNGASVCIQSSGDRSIPTSNGLLCLLDVLHAPHLSKNLVSVSKLCLDNNVVVEFHPNAFFVKDKSSGCVLLQG